MKYDLSKSEYEINKAQEYLYKLVKEGAKVSITKIHPKRSVSQNSYLHVLFKLWGKEFGYTIDEAKDTVKDALGYTYESDKGRLFNQLIPFSRVSVHRKKTSDMDSKELTIFIDKFRDWSADTCGYYLCSPEEYLLEQIYFDNEVEKEL